MKIRFTERLRTSYAEAPQAVQKAFDKQARLLAQNLHHPSLHANKYDEAQDVWQARVNRDWRFYFVIKGPRSGAITGDTQLHYKEAFRMQASTARSWTTCLWALFVMPLVTP